MGGAKTQTTKADLLFHIAPRPCLFLLNTPPITQIHVLIKFSCLQSKNKHVFLPPLVCQGDDAAAAATVAENMAESPDVTDPAEATEVRLAAAREAFILQSVTSPAEALTYVCAPLPPQEDADD